MDARPQDPQGAEAARASGPRTSPPIRFSCTARGTRRSSASSGKSMTRKGTPITSWRELTDVWIKIANDTLVETHRTPEFLEAQRRLTRSGAECRLQEREIVEAFCEMQQMPTRTEMDEVQREVYELRRRLRALEKAGAAVPHLLRKTAAPRTGGKPRRGARRAHNHDPRLEDVADELPHSIRSLADCEAVRRLQPASAARQRIAALGQGPGRADRHHAQDGGLPPGQDDALSLRADGQANRCRARCWSSTAWSAATRWPTCRRIAR